MYYTVVKRDGHLRTRGKYRKQEPQASVSTFIQCFQMTGVFYHSVIHGLGFFICFKIYILHAQNNKTRFFCVLYSDKTLVFDQSARAQGPIYILNSDKTNMGFSPIRARVQSPIYILMQIKLCSCVIVTTLSCKNREIASFLSFLIFWSGVIEWTLSSANSNGRSLPWAIKE